MKRINENNKNVLPGLHLKYAGTMIAAILLIVFKGYTQDKFPVPPPNASQLFYIQRTPNTNTIVYALNEKNGVIDVEKPVHEYWIRYGDQGQQEELSYIQRKFAYGVNAKLIDKDKYELRFVSYKKYVLYLMKAKDNKYHVYTTIDGKQAILNRVFIHIKTGGSFWSPNIDHVELNALDPSTGAAVTGVIKI